jgi:uncharacterized protein (DUF1684 family)
MAAGRPPELDLVAADADPDADAAFIAETLAFRVGRIERLTAADGWLTQVARYPLEGGDNQLPIGTVSLDGEGVARLSVTTGLEVTCDGQAVHQRTLRSDNDGPPGADRIVHGRLTYELIRRGEIAAIRVRDPDSDRRRMFSGTDWFPVRPAWRVQGTFEPFAEERLISIPYDLGPVLSRSPGQVALRFRQTPERIWRLDTLMDDQRQRLFLLFGDATNRDQTYGAGRFVYAPLPEVGSGRVTIDFNRALNPACAFTEFATCPLAPPQNRLPFRIEAGERRYLGP